MMVSRFQIEDMMTQDASGVVFRALDTETNQPVAVRRFFPFGVNGGGLSEDEQADYGIAVARLEDIRHPAMRAIIDGGCDPVDGMPFIATEWIEGVPLQSLIERAPLSAAETVYLITQALEVCEQISQVFGQEAVWVEMDVHTIIVGVEASGRGTTFWISPLKWLGKNDGQRGLEAIVSLTEDVMGWRGKNILDAEGGGLGGWLKWLRGVARKTTLAEARERLAGVGASATAATSSAPVKKLLPPARVIASKPQKRRSGVPVFVLGSLALAALAMGGWGLIRWNNARLPGMPEDTVVQAVEPESAAVNLPQPPPPVIRGEPVLTEPAPPESAPRPQRRTAEQASQEAAALLASAAAKDAVIAARNGVFRVEDSAMLFAQAGNEVTLEGTLKDFRYSKKETSLYLVFSDNPATGEVRGSVLLKSAPADLKEDSLSGLKGKKITLRGKVRIENFGKSPVISIKSRSAIREAE